MLVDRRELLENDIRKLHAEAADMYFDIVTHNKDVHSEEYQALKNKIVSLEFDLNVVNRLILQGQR
jgi:hypothetical protein